MSQNIGAVDRVVLSVVLAGSCLIAVPAVAQSPPPAGQIPAQATTASGFPVARARRVDQAPAIDGDVLGEAAWAVAIPETGFRQNTPDEGEPASERTEVRIVYTDEAIYFGVVCFVGDPATIIVSDARRDSSLVEIDSFQIVLDTYRDLQNGFVFGGPTRRGSSTTASSPTRARAAAASAAGWSYGPGASSSAARAVGST